MNIITGYRGEPHITSSQDRAKNQGMYGTGSYIMNVGQKLQAQVVSANEIRIRDGVLSHQGCIAVIENGAYDSLEISNGTQGMQRRDLIVARYTKDAETNVENITLVVIEGTPAASNPSDPVYNEGDIQAGDSPVDFPLYRVNISGVTISDTTRLASYVQTQAEADAAISAINSKTSGEGTTSNQYGECNYSWVAKAGIVTVYFTYTPSQNITSSSGALFISNAPLPAVNVYGATTDPEASGTVLGAVQLRPDRTIYLFGPRTANHEYQGSVTYVAN